MEQQTAKQQEEIKLAMQQKKITWEEVRKEEMMIPAMKEKMKAKDRRKKKYQTRRTKVK